MKAAVLQVKVIATCSSIGLKGSAGEGEQARLTRSPATTPTASLLHHLPGRLFQEIKTIRGDDPSGQVGGSNDADVRLGMSGVPTSHFVGGIFHNRESNVFSACRNHSN